jgi:uncharacterized cupin superfamily protein
LKQGKPPLVKPVPSVLNPADVTPRLGTIYPAPYDRELAGRAKRVLGDAFGLTQYGVNLTTLPPGCWSAHRHWHELEDEFIFVTAGEITLIDDLGEHVLTPGMCAGFKAGIPNGHHLVNKSAAPATYLEVGSRMPGERSHYPDVDMAGHKTENGWKVTRRDGSAF